MTNSNGTILTLASLFGLSLLKARGSRSAWFYQTGAQTGPNTDGPLAPIFMRMDPGQQPAGADQPVSLATIQRVLKYVRRRDVVGDPGYNIAALVISDTLLATRPKAFTGGTHLYLVFAGANNQPRHTTGGTELIQLDNLPAIILPMGQIKEEGRLKQTCQRWGQTFCMWNAGGRIDSHSKAYIGGALGHAGKGHYPEQLIELLLACQQKRISLSKILGWVDSSPGERGLPKNVPAPTNKVLLQEFFQRENVNKNYPAPGLEDRIMEIFRPSDSPSGWKSSTLRLPVTGGLLKTLQKMADKTRGGGQGWLSHIWLSVDPRRSPKPRTGLMQLSCSDGNMGALVSWAVPHTETNAFWESHEEEDELWIARVPPIIPEITQKESEITLTIKYQHGRSGFTVSSGPGMARNQPLPTKSGKKEIRYTGRSASVTIWHDSYSGVMASDPHLYDRPEDRPVTVDKLEPIITAALSGRKWWFTVNGKDLEREIKRELANSLKPLKGTINNPVTITFQGTAAGGATITCSQGASVVKWDSQSIHLVGRATGQGSWQFMINLKFLRWTLDLYRTAKVPKVELSIAPLPDPILWRGVTETGVRLSAIIMPMRGD